jgi:hypothetical protein
MNGQKRYSLLWEAAEKPCGIFEYHWPFKVLVLFTKIKKSKFCIKNEIKLLNFCTNLVPTWEYEHYKIRLTINIIDLLLFVFITSDLTLFT